MLHRIRQAWAVDDDDQFDGPVEVDEHGSYAGMPEFAGKHNIRNSRTLAQMRDTVTRLVGCRLLYRSLVANNGLSSGSGA